MKLNIIHQSKNIVVLLMGVVITFFAGCEKGVDDPETEKQKDYLQYGSVVKEGLIAFYPFDGNVKDHNGNEPDVLGNLPSASVGRFGQQGGALKFDGIKNYIEIPYFRNVNGQEGTICLWVRTYNMNRTNICAAVISKIDTVGFGYVLSLYGLYSFWFDYKIPYLRGGESMFTSSGGQGKYMFVAVTFSKNRLTYYSQGNPTAESTLGGGDYVFNNNNQSLFIGKSLITKYEYFEGELDDLLIYDRELSKDEILKLYNWK